MRILYLMRVSFALAVSLLILHEMDAVYWKEWQLFGLSDDFSGRNIFVLVHLPAYIFQSLHKKWAIRVSQIISLFLIVHFVLHLNAFKTENVFTETVSFGIISMMVPVAFVFLVSSWLYLRRVCPR